jgi:hypothetical protein
MDMAGRASSRWRSVNALCTQPSIDKLLRLLCRAEAFRVDHFFHGLWILALINDAKMCPAAERKRAAVLAPVRACCRKSLWLPKQLLHGFVQLSAVSAGLLGGNCGSDDASRCRYYFFPRGFCFRFGFIG